MKSNKYNYLFVIQQNYGFGWEDVSEYECNSNGILTEENKHSGKFFTNTHGKTRELTLLDHDVKEYRLTGYSTRVIFRKELKTELI